MNGVKIRKAISSDAEVLHNFILELARFENEEQSVVCTPEDIASTIEQGKFAQAVICEVDECPVGFAFYFFGFSTWTGKAVLFLEDLYIAPNRRRQGIGTQLLSFLANMALEHNCGRFEWNVLDWDETAIGLYSAVKAVPLSEWTRFRLDGESLVQLAAMSREDTLGEER